MIEYSSDDLPVKKSSDKNCIVLSIINNITPWDDYNILFDRYISHKLPEPNEYFKEEDLFVMKWGDIHCVILPFQNVLILDNKRNEKYFFYDDYETGIEKLFELLL